MDVFFDSSGRMLYERYIRARLDQLDPSNPIAVMVKGGFEPDAEERGIRFAPVEFLGQPLLWRETARRMAGEYRDNVQRVADFIATDCDEVLTSGAGTSHFIGLTYGPELLYRMQKRFVPIESTETTTAPQYHLLRNGKGLIIHAARSGNSPESVATMRNAFDLFPKYRHVIITCNPHSKMLSLAENHKGRVFPPFILHPRNNDQGLAMIRAYSSMVVAALSLANANDLDSYVNQIDSLAHAGERLMGDYGSMLTGIGETGYPKALYTGTGPNFGVATESALKRSELTGGKGTSISTNTYGTAHGPISFIEKGLRSLVAYQITDEGLRLGDGIPDSNDPTWVTRASDISSLERYGDALHDFGADILVVCDRPTEELRRHADYVVEFDPERKLDPGTFTPPVRVLPAQWIAITESSKRGYRPDDPGIATYGRVVTDASVGDVVAYDFQAFSRGSGLVPILRD